MDNWKEAHLFRARDPFSIITSPSSQTATPDAGVLRSEDCRCFRLTTFSPYFVECFFCFRSSSLHSLAWPVIFVSSICFSLLNLAFLSLRSSPLSLTFRPITLHFLAVPRIAVHLHLHVQACLCLHYLSEADLASRSGSAHQSGSWSGGDCYLGIFIYFSRRAPFLGSISFVALLHCCAAPFLRPMSSLPQTLRR
jgi:hypothetical protein